MSEDNQGASLAEFLLARITEDEAMWQAAAQWMKPLPVEIRDASGEALVTVVADPARVLAECEAKRRIVAAWETCGRVAGRTFPEGAAQPSSLDWYDGQRYGLVEAVQNLAAVYSDHPDYREEWRP